MTLFHRLVPTVIREHLRFYKRYTPTELKFLPNVSFSQFGEDIVMDKCLFSKQETGFYVEIGAFDPFHISNTHYFYRKGWRGLNVEPNPEGFRRFQKHRPRDINLNCAVSDVERNVEFTLDSVYSGINDETHFCRNRNPEARHITIAARRLDAILEAHLPKDVTIDFMSVDCEGHDRIVLESNDWTRFRPRVVVAEELGENRKLDSYMESKGYRLFFQASYSKIYTENGWNPAAC